MGIIYDVSKQKEEYLEKKISDIMSMYEYYFKEGEDLYKCLTREKWIEGYTHIYK